MLVVVVFVVVTRIIHVSRLRRPSVSQSFGAIQVLASTGASVTARLLLPHLTSAACAILKAVASTEN